MIWRVPCSFWGLLEASSLDYSTGILLTITPDGGALIKRQATADQLHNCPLPSPAKTDSSYLQQVWQGFTEITEESTEIFPENRELTMIPLSPVHSEADIY